MRRTPKENINQSFINLIRKAHGLIENSDIEKHRHSQDQMGALFGNSREVAVTETTVGSMYAEWIRVDRPHSEKKIILYCHGGGYSTGSPLYARTLTTKLASQLSMDVFCFDYRLAPEHPYPAAVDDAQAAWDFLMLQGYGAKDIFVAGDSAGGNLALALGLRLKKQKRMLPAGFVLMSPWTDLTVSGKTHETKADVDPVLNQNYLNEMIENYVPQAKKVQMEAVNPLQEADTLRASNPLQEGNTLRVAGALQEGNTIQAAGTIQEGNTIQAAGTLQEGNTIQAAGNLQEGNTIRAAGNLQERNTIRAAGTIQEGNTIWAAGNLQEGNTIRASFNLQEGIALRVADNLQERNTIQAAGTLQERNTLRAAGNLQERNTIQAAGTIQEGNILQTANTLQTAGTEKQKPGDKSANKVFEEIFDTEYLRNPEISPLFGDFTGFPPTYIQVGDLEVLMSDSTMLQKKMSGDGVAVSLDTYKNMWHVFQMGPFKTAVEAIHKCGEFIYSVQ